MRAERPDWSGAVVVCIASGPSLTAEDCETVRLSGHRTIVTNSTFRLAPWADILFGFDSRWWKAHLEEIRFARVRSRLLSASAIAGNLGVETTHNAGWLRAYPNSGAAAIGIALAAGARRVVLLGYDCGFAPDGRRHWHEDHPVGMSNCQSIAAWPKHFKHVAADAERAGIPVANASRATALRCFPRIELGAAL